MAVALEAWRSDRERGGCSRPEQNIRLESAILPVLVGMKSFPCASVGGTGGETMATRGASFDGTRNVCNPHLERERRQVRPRPRWCTDSAHVVPDGRDNHTC